MIDLDEVIANKFKGAKVPAWAVRFFKRLIHLDFINEHIRRSGHEGDEFCRDIIRQLDITVDVKGLENIPADGTLYTFASNHPLGGVDGMTLCGLIGERFGQVRMLVNDFLMYIEPLAPLCVPVNKTGAQARDLPQRVDEAFHSSQQMLMFPAGACSRRTDGIIQDYPWTKTFIKKSVETGRPIVPVHFIGENSPRFYRIATWCRRLGIKFNIAMLFLPDEMCRSQHGHYRVVFGEPIPPERFDSSRSAAEWAAVVREEVYRLS